MAKEYTREQLWKLYEKLPGELKEVIFSEETADNIWNVCEKNGVEGVSQVAKYAGYVLMGVLPPEEFQKTLEAEVGLEEEKAKKVTQEINRFIFWPVKASLEEIYKIEIKPPVGMPTIKPPEVVRPVEEVKPEVKPEEVPRKDIYREPVE